MKILMAASEMAPLAKTGGLGDILCALPRTLARRGHDVSVLIPYYRCAQSSSAKLLARDTIPIGSKILSFGVMDLGLNHGVRVYGIQKEEYFDRTYLYGPPEHDYEDNAERFAFFSHAVIQALRSLKWEPDLIHLHDWHSALVAAYLHHERRNGFLSNTRTLFTIHNLAYQGIFPSREFDLTHLPPAYFSLHGLEFYGQINFLKGGIVYADAVSTVSPRHALEIQTNEYGCRLDSTLRARGDVIHGILNGIDYTDWDPTADVQLPRPFSARSLEGKTSCKLGLLQKLGLLERDDRPLLGMVTRFAQQKGMEILLQSIPGLVERDLTLALLGHGDAFYEEALRATAKRYSNHVRLKIGFDDTLARRIYAGSDFFLMPSLYEPCGLGQLYAMRYGSIPIVRATGGLEDSVVEWNGDVGTGFKFKEPTSEAFLKALDRAHDAWNTSSILAKIRREAMNTDFSWNASTLAYESLYRSIASLSTRTLRNS